MRAKLNSRGGGKSFLEISSFAVTRIELATKILFENDGFDARIAHTTYALNECIAFTKLLKSDRFLLPSGSTVSNLGYFHLFLIKSKAS